MPESSNGPFLVISFPVDFRSSYSSVLLLLFCLFFIPSNFLMDTGHCRGHSIKICKLPKTVDFVLVVVLLLADHLDLLLAWFLHFVSMKLFVF